MINIFAVAAIALTAGLVLSWLIRGYQLKAAYGAEPAEVNKQREALETSKNTISTLEERNAQAEKQLNEHREHRERLTNRNTKLESALASLETDFHHAKQRLKEQKDELETTQLQMREQFKNLANDILEEKSKRFSELNQTEISRILKPLGENIDSFRKKVEETYEKGAIQHATLKEQITGLTDLNKRMSEDANNLTKALKGDSKTQGNWGEVVLERILERSGLRKGFEYETQFSGKTEEGNQLRPDVVIHLPDEKYLVVDAKVSLTAYERLMSAETAEEQEIHAKQHLLSLRTHYKSLSGKDYTQLFERTPDFVLMFIPIEPAFGMAMTHDPNLYNEAFERNIVLVSPSTLLATMATIRNIWKYEYQSQNAQEIAKRGGLLYDKFVGFAEDLEAIGKQLRKTQDTYDSAMGKLSTGRGNLISRAEKMKELGVDSRKNLPAELRIADNGSEEHDTTDD